MSANFPPISEQVLQFQHMQIMKLESENTRLKAELAEAKDMQHNLGRCFCEDITRLDFKIEECNRIGKTLSDMASMASSPSTKRLLDTLAVAVSKNRQDIDECLKKQSNLHGNNENMGLIKD